MSANYPEKLSSFAHHSNLLNYRVLISSLIGNALEFYDFVLCGILMPQLAPLFFPSAHPLSSLLIGMAAYAVGFIMRPLGGILFGYIGSYGRKTALTISITGMALSTFLFALIPTYEHIGIFSGVIFVILRLCQGLCLGGEVMGSPLFALEHHKKQRGLIGGIIAAGAMAGAFLASIISFALINFLEGWRIAFLFGAITGLIGFYIRRYLPETPEYEKTKKSKKFPLFMVAKYYPYNFFAVFSYGAIAGSLATTIMVFLNIYCTKILSLTTNTGLKLTAFTTISAIILHPITGLFVDRIGPKKAMQFFCILTLIIIFPAYSLFITKNNLFMSLGALMLALSYSGIAAAGYAFVLDCFPPEFRYSGSAVSYNLAQALFGGTQPVIALFLIQSFNSFIVPAIYLALLSIFCLVTISLKKLKVNSDISSLLESEETFLPTLNTTGSVTKILDPFSEEFIDFSSHCSFPVADLGVGYGFTTYKALEKGATVIANDLESKHIQVLIDRLPDKYKTRLTTKIGAIPEEIEFDKNSLGGILASRFLHFLSGAKIEEAILKMYQWLKPGGKLFVVTETPYLGNLKDFIPIYEDKKAKGEPWPGIIHNFDKYFPEQPTPTFGNLLDPDILIRVFQKTGFIVEKSSFIERPYYPEGVRYSGKESVGIVGRKE